MNGRRKLLWAHVGTLFRPLVFLTFRRVCEVADNWLVSGAFLWGFSRFLLLAFLFSLTFLTSLASRCVGTGRV